MKKTLHEIKKHYKKTGMRLGALLLSTALAGVSIPTYGSAAEIAGGVGEKTQNRETGHWKASPSEAAPTHDDAAPTHGEAASTPSDAAATSSNAAESTALNLKREAGKEVGDFLLTDIKDASYTWDNKEHVLSIKGEAGSVTVSMKSGVESTGDCIVINASDTPVHVFLDGVNIEAADHAPIWITGTGTAYVNMKEGTENDLTTAEGVNAYHAALEIGSSATLIIGGDEGAAGTLNAKADKGAAIGGAYGFRIGDKKWEPDSGSIDIRTGTINAESANGTGIGGGYGGNSGSIIIGTDGGTQDENPVAVNVNAYYNGIGGGYNSKKTDDIVIRGEAVVNVISSDGTGIGGGYSNSKPNLSMASGIEISQGANVTVETKRHNGIGAGYSGEVGPILIKDSTVSVTTSQEAAIGSGFEGKNGDISIRNSTVTVNVSEDSYNPGVGIGNRSSMLSGAVEIERSILKVDGFNCGVSANLDPAEGIVNGITLNYSEVEITDCAAALSSQGSMGEYGPVGFIVITGGSLTVTGSEDKAQLGIGLYGEEGTIDLNENCDIRLEVPVGIYTDGALNVATDKLVIEFEGQYFSSAAVQGKGSLVFQNGAVTKISSSGDAIHLDGDKSSVIFQDGSVSEIKGYENAIRLDGKEARLEFLDGCKVHAENTSPSQWSGYVLRCDNTINIGHDSDVVAVAAGTDCKMIRTDTLEGGSCILVINAKSDLKGKNVEIRDKNGVSLTPAVAYSQEEGYHCLALQLPKPGEYTCYVNGEIQEYGDYWNQSTMIDVVEGINKTVAIQGDAASKPVTGLTLDPSSVTMGVGGIAEIACTVKPDNADNKEVTAVSDNPSVADASVNGTTIQVNAKAVGTADITVKTVDGGFGAVCKVTVTKEPPVMETYRMAIKGRNGSDSLEYENYKAGETVYLHAGTVSGSRFTKWFSTDKDVTFANPNAADTAFVMPEHEVSVEARWTKQDDGMTHTGSGSSSSGSGSADIDYITQLHKGNGVLSDAVWSQREDGTWTAAVGGVTPKNTWACLKNPYAGDEQPKGGWFWFDENGTMKSGWFTGPDGRKYYLEVKREGIQGMMSVGWKWIDGKCYYFGADIYGDVLGALVTNGKTPDGYDVNEAGEWVVNGAVQIK